MFEKNEISLLNVSCYVLNLFMSYKKHDIRGLQANGKNYDCFFTDRRDRILKTSPSLLYCTAFAKPQAHMGECQHAANICMTPVFWRTSQIELARNIELLKI
jgi:hypothetical protein